jgi:hypothetical protein
MARVLDPHVERLFLDALRADGPLAEAMETSASVEAAADALEAAEGELIAYRDEPLIASTLGPSVFAEGLRVRAEAVHKAQSRLSESRQHGALIQPLTSGSLAEAWPGLSVAEKRRMLTASIDAIMIRPVRGTGAHVDIADRVHVLWRGQAPDGLPRRGHRVPLESFPWPDKPPADIGVAVGKKPKPRRRKVAAR